jgi:hypothetical protein
MDDSQDLMCRHLAQGFSSVHAANRWVCCQEPEHEGPHLRVLLAPRVSMLRCGADLSAKHQQKRPRLRAFPWFAAEAAISVE